MKKKGEDDRISFLRNTFQPNGIADDFQEFVLVLSRRWRVHSFQGNKKTWDGVREPDPGGLGTVTGALWVSGALSVSLSLEWGWSFYLEWSLQGLKEVLSVKVSLPSHTIPNLEDLSSGSGPARVWLVGRVIEVIRGHCQFHDGEPRLPFLDQGCGHGDNLTILFLHIYLLSTCSVPSILLVLG